MKYLYIYTYKYTANKHISIYPFFPRKQEKLEAAQAAKEKVQGLTALVNQLGPKIEQLGTELRTATKEPLALEGAEWTCPQATR